MKAYLLTSSNYKRLGDLEKIISEGKRAFVAVGTALAEIRDSKLYRVEHKTFEDYCREQWGWQKAHAYRLIEAANVVKASPIGDKITTESQARELAKAPEERRAEIIQSVADNGPVTAKAIKAEVEATEGDSEPPRVVAHSEVMPNPVLPSDEDRAVLLYARLEAIVTKRWHRFCEAYTVEELPMVRKIIRPLVARE